MAAWTPDLLPALQSWFDAQDSSTITLDGSSRVEAWVDKGPAGITLGNTTPTELPNEGTINGNNAINFDASQWLEPDSHPISLNENRALTVYIVFEVDDNGISNRPLSLTYDGRELFDYYNFSMSRNAGVLDVSWGRGTNTASFSFANFRTEGWDTSALTPYLYGVSITTAGAVARHDGAAQALTNRSSGTMSASNFLVDAPATPDVGVQLGCYNNSGAISQEMDGRIGEIIICNDDESLFDKQRIEGYLAHKWGLEGDLPSDHPFKAAAPEVPQDPYYNEVFLQLPFDGTDGDTSTSGNEINPLAVTFAGTAQLDDAQKKFGDTSLVLDGNSDYLTVGAIADWNFLHDNTEDYTAEFWFRVNAATGTTQVLYDTGSATTMRGAAVYIVDTSGTLTLSALIGRGTSGTYAAQILGATALATGTWYHCAAVVSGTQLELFLDGASEGTAAIVSPSVSAAQYTLNIGRYQQGNSSWFDGHIDDFRVTKGVARYLGDFAVPERTITGIAIDAHYDNVTLLLPFEGADGDTSTTDLSAAGNTVTFFGTAQIDNSRARYGDTALLLDGDSDYLTADTALDDVSATTDPWTIEGWFYPTTIAGDWSFFGINNSSDGANIFVPLYNEWAGISGGNKAYSTPFTANEWQHFAASYDGARLRVFRNGAVISDTAQTIPTTLSAANFAIGAEFDSGSSGTPGNYFPGSVDDARFTAGFARYTAAFTAPQAPAYIPAPVAVAQDPYYDSVVLQLPFDGTDGDTSTTDESLLANTLTFVGTAQLDDAQAKFGATSLLLDGNSDYVDAGADVTFDFASDWTIEAFCRFSSLGRNDGILMFNSTSSNLTGRFLLYKHSTNSIRIFAETSGDTEIVFTEHTTNDVSAETWHHIAAVKSGSTVTVYVDGSEVASDTWSGTYDAGTNCYVGLGVTGSGAQYCDGHIDDVRVTNGLARYLGDFSPPARTITDVAVDAHYDDVTLLLPFEGTDGDTSTTDGSLSPKTIAFVDNAALDDAQKKFGTTSALFDGTGDSVTAYDDNDGSFDIAGGDFTFELFVRFASVPAGGGYAALAAHRVNSSSENGWSLWYGGTEKLHFYYSTTGTDQSTITGLDATTPSPNVWYHIALVRSGNDLDIYVDGVKGTTQTLSATVFYPDSLFTLGAARAGVSTYTFGLDGHIDDVRFTKGFARYTAAFTPPQSPAEFPPAVGPTIGTQPQSATVDENTTATFTVVATASAGSLSYQWYDASDDSVLVGETADTLSFTAVFADNGNTYYVVVTDSNGSIQSSTATLTVTDLAPTIDTQPQATSIGVSESGVLSVSATASAGALSYQWYRDAVLLPGETGSSLTVQGNIANDGIDYYVIVSDINGSVQSSSATITIIIPPIEILIDLPASTAVTQYTTPTLEVSVKNFLSAQWYEVGVGAIAGETKQKLSLYITPDDDGRQFYVAITDRNGETGNSTTTTLSVISTSLVDSTDAPAGSTFDASNPVRHRTVDWGAQMAAVDKEVIDVPDYEFSGRTFTRRDRLRNPK